MSTYENRARLAKHPLAQRLFKLMAEKKTNLALSADVTSAAALLTLADQLGPHIAVLKTHIDIINDFTPALTQQLVQLAQKHQFLIFEDRKFADIGNTVQMQYQQGIFHIAEWADIVNAHTLPGPGIIEGLKQIGASKGRGLLLIAELSSKGHLLDAAYVQKTLALAEAHRDFVMGFITQKAYTKDPGLVYLTPGVMLAQKGDALGQQYRTPEEAIVRDGCDMIIVGRGILADQNPLEATKRYQTAAWEAYLFSKNSVNISSVK